MNNIYNFKAKRTGKQCRERWLYQLSPHIKVENFSAEEEKILFSKHIELGNKWNDLTKFLPGR